jgi:glycosyltransferase involved in cell wall biosynthesis
MTSRFTIIIPSYNGGEYLKESVRSVLAQTFLGFDLAVLDDCSTDGSIGWLRDLKDARIRVYPSSERLGIVGNWARALTIPRAPFMTIMGQDDLLDASYLQVMNDLIERQPDATLYHAHFRYIHNNGNFQRTCRSMPERESAAEYLASLFSGNRDTYGTGYMMRSADYDALGGIPHYKNLLFADDALWISLMLRSYKATAREECFSCRVHLGSTSGSATWQAWMAAMREYVPFLESAAASDAELAKAYAVHRDPYFLNWFRMLYTLASVQATRANHRSPRELSTKWQPGDEILPHLGPQFRRIRYSKAFVCATPLTGTHRCAGL